MTGSQRTGDQCWGHWEINKNSNKELTIQKSRMFKNQRLIIFKGTMKEICIHIYKESRLQNFGLFSGFILIIFCSKMSLCVIHNFY